MNMVLSISAGAIIGALGRYYLMMWIARAVGNSFPWNTLIINAVGSLLMGAFIEAVAVKLSVSKELQALIVVGILGSFTTFSTFSLDAAVLIQKGDWVQALAYVLSSVVIGVSALFFGIYLVKFFAG